VRRVIRLLPDQPEVTEELVVTASLVSLEVWSAGARRKLPDGSGQVGDRSGVLVLAFF
jgi:hypothetical protein